MNVYMWGRGEDGQIGLGDTSDQFKPMLIESLKDAERDQFGSGHTVILTTKDVSSVGDEVMTEDLVTGSGI